MRGGVDGSHHPGRSFFDPFRIYRGSMFWVSFCGLKHVGAARCFVANPSHG
jgi:hypothetical protein